MEVILSCVLLFIFYNIWVFLFLNTANYPIVDSIDRAEKFVYSKMKYDRVIVGSGLIGGLTFSSKLNVYNLFFPYFGACTGISILAKSYKQTSKIIVETNYLFKGSDDSLLNKVYSNSRIKSYLPCLIQQNTFLRHLKNMYKVLFPKKLENASAEIFDMDKLDFFEREYSTIPEIDKFEKDILDFKKNIQQLVEKGCVIYLFEIPLHPALRELPLFTFQREKIKEYLDGVSFEWITMPSTIDLNTTDGIHLTRESSLLLSNFLESKLS